MASTISAACVNLFDLLALAEELAGVQLSFGPPDAYEEQEVVALLRVEEPDEAGAALGPAAKREESYVLVVRVKAHDPAADSGQEVFLRVQALREAVRATVVANPRLNDAVREADIVGGGPDSAGLGFAVPAQGSGWVAFSDARIQCKARIS